MAYCAQADLETRIGVIALAQLTNDTARATSPNSTIVDAMIARADTLINSFAGQVYDVPFTSVPDIVKNLSVDLACFYAMQRRPVEYPMPEDWKNVERDAKKILQQIADLVIKLDDSTEVESKEADIKESTASRLNFDDPCKPESRY